DVLKTVASLSGGEKARSVLAKLMLENANLLIMDEPTNHLDLDSKEVLEAALIDFPGTIIFVSHDRFFINRIATTVFEMTPEGTTKYLGNYDYYMEKKQEQQELDALNEQEKQKKEQPSDKSQFFQDKAVKREIRKLERQIDELETSIQELEEKIEANEQLMYDPEIVEDHVKLRELVEQNEQMQKNIDNLMEEWTEVQEELSKWK